MASPNYKSLAVRAAAILTNSYVAATVLEKAETDNQLVLYVDYTKGSLTTAELKVEFSTDNSNFYQETFQAISTGTATEVLGEHVIPVGASRILIPIKDRYIRVSVKGTGTVTASSMAITAIVGQV